MSRTKEVSKAYNLAMKALKTKYSDEFNKLYEEARNMLGVPYIYGRIDEETLEVQQLFERMNKVNA